MTDLAPGVPPHPTMPGLPAPLVAHYVDPTRTEGPWRVLHKAARAADWIVKAFAARGWHYDANGNLSALTDTFSLRGWRDRNEIGDVDRFAAVWARPTWPVMGRGKTEHVGEGRADNAGKLWTWHPPMELPTGIDVNGAFLVDIPAASWKFSAGWIWTIGAALRPASAAQVRDWVKAERTSA